MNWIQSISPVGGVHLKKGRRRNATPEVFSYWPMRPQRMEVVPGRYESLWPCGRKHWSKEVLGVGFHCICWIEKVVWTGRICRGNVGVTYFKAYCLAFWFVTRPRSGNSVMQNLNLRQLYLWKCYSSNLLDAMLWGLLTWCNCAQLLYIIYISLFQWFCRVFQHAGCLLEHITFGNFKDWHGLCAKGLSEMCRSIT